MCLWNHTNDRVLSQCESTVFVVRSEEKSLKTVLFINAATLTLANDCMHTLCMGVI